MPRRACASIAVAAAFAGVVAGIVASPIAGSRTAAGTLDLNGP
jgi:hypothetical protein